MMTSSFNPRVTIVIPVYNCEKYIQEAIESVLAQSYKNLELIVVDDGSTDNTVQRIQSLPYEVKLIQQANAGQSAALTTGWKNATGEIIGYLSSDDTLYPGLISESIDAFLDESVVLTFPYFDLIDSRSLKLKTVTPVWHSFEHLLGTLSNPIGPGALFRKHLFTDTNGWNSSYRQMQDLDFWLRTCDRGVVRVIPKVLATFRVHQDSSTFSGASVIKATEPVRIVESFFKSEQSKSYSKLHDEAISNAYILSGQLHIRAGRILMGLRSFSRGFLLNKENIFKYQTLRIVLNACFSRSYYVFFVPVLRYVKSMKQKVLGLSCRAIS